MNTPPDSAYVADPPTRHTVREGRIDRGMAQRLQLEENPVVRQWMADVLRAHGWVCFPPNCTAASLGGPEIVWCEAHGAHHPRADDCPPAPVEVPV